MKYKTQFSRITDTFIGVTAVILAAVLVVSGMAVTKINTEYMETGIKTAKIVAERENEEIFFSLNGRKFSPAQSMDEKLKTAALLLPAPLNAVIYLGEEIREMIKTKYYQMADKDYKSTKTIGRALEEVYENLIHIDKR